MFQSMAKASDFKSRMTYEILLIVVLGGIGSVTGSCIGAFLYIAASEWWLRGLDNGDFAWHHCSRYFQNRVPSCHLLANYHVCRSVLASRDTHGRQEFDGRAYRKPFRNEYSCGLRILKEEKWRVSDNE